VNVRIRRDLHSRLESDGDSLFPAGLASGYETKPDLKGKKVVANPEKTLARIDHGEPINVNQNLYRARHNPCCFGSD
jgi:hypothetical protein